LGKRGYREDTGWAFEPILPLRPSDIEAEAREVWENLRTGRTHKDKGGLCTRACCTYAEYQRTIIPGRGRRFTAETFFLEWLAHDLLFWFRRRIREYGKDSSEFDAKIEERIAWDPVKGKSNPGSDTGRRRFPNLQAALRPQGVIVAFDFPSGLRKILKIPRGLYKQTALFIDEYLQDLGLNESAKRIKIRARQPRNSEVLRKLKQRIRIKVWRLRKSGLLPELERRLIYSSTRKDQGRI